MRCAVVTTYVTIAMAMCIAGTAQSGPAPGLGSAAKPSVLGLEKVHGFHCREEFGWDPRAGRYTRHSHAGICQDYKRCLEVHHRCIFIHGRGFEGWRYERWGKDNWRYTNCMLERQCY